MSKDATLEQLVQKAVETAETAQKGMFVSKEITNTRDMVSPVTGKVNIESESPLSDADLIIPELMELHLPDRDLSELEYESLQELLRSNEEEEPMDVAIAEEVTTTVITPPPSVTTTPAEQGPLPGAGKRAEETGKVPSPEVDDAALLQSLVEALTRNPQLLGKVAEKILPLLPQGTSQSSEVPRTETTLKKKREKAKPTGKKTPRPRTEKSLGEEALLRHQLLQHGGEGPSGSSSGTRIPKRKTPGDSESVPRKSQLTPEPHPEDEPARKRSRTGLAPARLCWNCRKPGHNGKECPEPPTTYCRGCGRPGKERRDCPVCEKQRKARGPWIPEFGRNVPRDILKAMGQARKLQQREKAERKPTPEKPETSRTPKTSRRSEEARTRRKELRKLRRKAQQLTLNPVEKMEETPSTGKEEKPV
ncbi:serine/arginine repetitive matrix protein 1-like [Fopius arisanus]|uniref:Serine/arginine repetitive matrix protein 1-like n=1 Tax=Fopius arisanus TaxID=64838 RepID=A0A9R1TNW9_9HYME|nr:PREDICTED: serine/arginine repetitive matrix protein 1-like [Fopius arisanus]